MTDVKCVSSPYLAVLITVLMPQGLRAGQQRDPIDACTAEVWRSGFLNIVLTSSAGPRALTTPAAY